MAFHSLEEHSIPHLREFFWNLDELGDDYSAANCWAWAHLYQTEIDCRGGFLFLRFQSPECLPFYMCPVGEGDFGEALNYIEQCRGGECAEVLCDAAQIHKFPGTYEAVRRPEMDDYLYLADRFIDLPGKAFDGKRNHISRFKRCYDWSFRPLDDENAGDCREIADRWLSCREPDFMLLEERRAIERFLTYREALGVLGGVLYVSGQPAAFALGSIPRARMLDVHIEKALFYDGAYAMIAREFAAYARTVCPVEYINREDDMGIESLRRAKMSYHPDRMVEKYGMRPRGQGAKCARMY